VAEEKPEGGATVTGEIAPGVPLTIEAGEGKKTTVTLLGKPVDKLQLKDLLPLLSLLKR
jgi:hypothetical protein